MVSKDNNVYSTGDVPSKDWFLQFLVNLANHNKIELDITLIVGGSLVSGTLIGVRDYFDAMGAHFTDSLSSLQSTEEIRATFQKIGEQCSCVTPSEKTETPSYIHLRNARFHSGEGQSVAVRNNGSLWRGRISEVEGFAPGS